MPESVDIHHAMIVQASPGRLYQALTQAHDLAIWMGAPTRAQPEVGSAVEFQFDRGQRVLKMEVAQLEAEKLVQWLIIRFMDLGDVTGQIITWQLSAVADSTLVDFRMAGWPQDDDTYASVSYKWASYMMRLKIYMGDTREIDGFLNNPSLADDGES